MSMLVPLFFTLCLLKAKLLACNKKPYDICCFKKNLVSEHHLQFHSCKTEGIGAFTAEFFCFLQSHYYCFSLSLTQSEMLFSHSPQ